MRGVSPHGEHHPAGGAPPPLAALERPWCLRCGRWRLRPQRHGQALGRPRWAPCRHGRLRGRRAARAGLGRGRSRQTGGDSSSASKGSARVMSCPKASRATPVATRPQSAASPRSMAGTSQCSRRPRPSPHPQIPPRRSPHTVTQPSRDGLALSLAMMLPQRAQAGSLPGSILHASASSRGTPGHTRPNGCRAGRHGEPGPRYPWARRRDCWAAR